MNYNKTTWDTGDIVTAEKLNNIENGIASAGSGVLMVHVNVDETTGAPSLDKTWQEIYDAVEADKIVALKTADRGRSFGYLMTIYGIIVPIINSDEDETIYYVGFLHNDGDLQFRTTDPNEYPVFADGGGGGDVPPT